MNNKQILEDVYKDFFGDVKGDQENKSVTEEEDNNYSVDKLYIDEQSKILLTKMIKYMEDYSSGKEKNYLTFNVSVESDDKNTVTNISNLLKYYATKYKFIDNRNMSNLSLYKVDKYEDINKYYKDNGLIVLEDLEAIQMNDVSFLTKFFYNLKNELSNKKITIISGKKDTVDKFLLEDSSLKDYFCFKLIGIRPDINDIYNEILDKVKTDDLGEEFNVKILDYITETYSKSEESATKYIENLCKFISFYKDVPKIDEIKSIDDVFSELNELVGLDNVKKTLHDLVDLITLKQKTGNSLKINNVNLHMVFLGNPGTGKTTVARMIGDILYNLKYIKQNKLIEVSSKDLVAEYVGQTAVKTMNVINKAMGGILFIDEAYALADKNNENSYNGECIATLIKAMEDYRDDLVVIFAGYTKEMQDFLDSNSGIVSRIGYTLVFNDYTNEELKQIFKGMVTKAGFVLEEDALDEVEKLIDENRNIKNFGNARFIRNIYEKSVIKHATNTKNNKSKKILKTITKKDITL